MFKSCKLSSFISFSPRFGSISNLWKREKPVSTQNHRGPSKAVQPLLWMPDLPSWASPAELNFQQSVPGQCWYLPRASWVGIYQNFYLLCYGCAFPPTLWFCGWNFTSLRNVCRFSGLSRVHTVMEICSYLFTFLGFLFFPLEVISSGGNVPCSPAAQI